MHYAPMAPMEPPDYPNPELELFLETAPEDELWDLYDRSFELGDYASMELVRSAACLRFTES